jgi:hypothetical protein
MLNFDMRSSSRNSNLLHVVVKKYNITFQDNKLSLYMCQNIKSQCTFVLYNSVLSYVQEAQRLWEHLGLDKTLVIHHLNISV